ncbi:MAG: NAD-dependent epimerase/dehydratase family protein [Solirubrobacteraceae bacterium]
MRVVVLGATGNVGTSVVRALDADPAVESIVGVARRAPGEPGEGKTEYRVADIRVDPLDNLFDGADAVIHLAWLIQPSRDQALLRAVNVEGTRRVFAAAGRARVPALVYASSVGAYSPGPKDRAVGEDWPTEGIASSFYARHKAEVERELDVFERDHPSTRVVRLRPALIFKREAASEIRRYFAGRLLPPTLVRRELVPIVPAMDRLRFQAVHADDVGEAYRLATVRDVRGAFNIAAEPVLDPDELGRILDARPVPVPPVALRLLALATWKLRLQPTPPGWVDMALAVPIMATERARSELGWTPRHSSADALLELIDGIHRRDGAPTPPLQPAAAT